VKSLIDAADPEMNVKLSGGEEIRVPTVGKVFVLGNVKQPGAFPLNDNTETTMLKAVAMAGGLTPLATKRAYIIRQDDKGTRNEIPIELGKIMDRKAPDATLLANDILYIPDAKGKRAAFAAIEKALIYGSGASSAVIYGSMH
jgi:polysaccharide export outer membrane protein